MRRKFGQSLCIGVSPSAVSLLRASRWGKGKTELLAEQAYAAGHGYEALAQALRELLAAQELAGWPVSFVVADEMLRLWQVTPPAGASRMADLEAAAALRFHGLFGEPPAAWEISADWNASQPFFAAAMPRALKAVLEQAAHERKLALVGIVPHFMAEWNRWCNAMRPGAWFGVVHDAVLTLAVIEGGKMRAIRALPLAHGADHYWLTQLVQREALLFDVPAPEQVLLCGSVPSGLAKPAANDSHVRTVLRGAGQGSGLSPAALLACAGSAA